MTADVIHDHLAVLTIWREARGEHFFGMRAVAYVIRNRMRQGGWPDSPGAVVLQRSQFSCWNDRDSQRLTFPGPDDPQLAMCEAAWILSGFEPDPTHGANHYHAATVLPRWADETKLTANIGNHKFYRL